MFFGMPPTSGSIPCLRSSLIAKLKLSLKKPITNTVAYAPARTKKDIKFYKTDTWPRLSLTLMFAFVMILFCLPSEEPWSQQI
jgi:hypothetical protein